jgi:transposase
LAAVSQPANERAARPLETTTFIAGLRNNGIVAPFVVDRIVNRTIFETWVEIALLPALGAGDIMVMDNLSSHKGPLYAH